VDRGRLIIERQRKIVACSGKLLSINLLETFEWTQEIFEMDLAALLKMK
jgi:hypothetical protein